MILFVKINRYRATEVIKADEIDVFGRDFIEFLLLIPSAFCR